MNYDEWPPKEALVKPPSRKSRLEAYLYDSAGQLSMDMAQELNYEQPLNRHVVLIPVAAHQEAGHIARAIDQYAAQEGAEPFSIILSLNSPEGSDRSAIESCMDEIDKAGQLHPNLDIRYVFNEYPPDTPIGRIRKDLWDATSFIALDSGAYDEPSGEVIGINHDIDTISIGRHYIRNIQRHYAKSQQHLNQMDTPEQVDKPRFTQVKHFYPFDTHPNIAKVMFWVDYAYRQYGPGGIYEEGLTMPLSHYAKMGGFDKNAKTYETGTLLPHNGYRLGISGTPMETSPRRYIQRLGEHGLHNIWTEESFGADDTCRVEEQPSDITDDQLESIVLESLGRDLSFFTGNISLDKWYSIIDESIFGGADFSPNDIKYQVESLVRAKHRLASQILRRVLGSDTLADLAMDESVIADGSREFSDAIINKVEDLQRATRNSRTHLI